MSPSVDEILEAIRNITIKEALTYLVVVGVTSFANIGFERLKKAIQDKENESKYAFVPDKNEANYLLSFVRNPNYREVSMLVPNYKYIDTIRTGLLIDYYHKHDSPKSRERVKQIKIQISRKPNGKKLLKLANLPTTPFFSVILQRLHQLKKDGYDSTFLEETFDELITDWTERSKLIEANDTVDDVISFCEEQMDGNSENFFVLGMKSASAIVEMALVKMLKERIIDKNKYQYTLTKSEEGNNPRTQLMVFLKD